MEVSRGPTPANLKPRNVGAAEEEAIEQTDILAQAKDVADAAGHIEHPVGVERIIVGATALDAQELRVGAKIGDILVELHDVAIGRQKAGIADIVGQVLADQNRSAHCLLPPG